jgi:serine/threonine protein kinase
MAPEVGRGEAYDQSMDVYSFGMLLLALSIDSSLEAFIGERWREDFKKEQVPRGIAFNRVGGYSLAPCVPRYMEQV